jgi:DNA-binding NarL/FixJ family response regulator
MNKSSSVKLRLCLAEDHQLVSMALRALLSEDPRLEVIGLARTGREALELAKTKRPDIMLLDLQLPEMHGLDVLREVKDLTAVCVLSMHDEPHYVTQALRAGARGYVSKSGSAAELKEAIQSIAAGETFLCSRTRKAALRAGSGAQLTSGFGALTKRELAVLDLCSRGKTSGAIARELGISRRTAEAHRASLMKKLVLKTQTELVRYALRQGIIEA